MITVRRIIAATTKLQQHRFGHLNRYRYIYTYTNIFQFLENPEAFFNEFRKGMTALEESQAKTKVALEELRKQQQDRMLIRMPLHPISIGIRRDFFTHYRIWKDQKLVSGDRDFIDIGNEATHYGSVITDSIMIRHRYIDDTHTFHELYGITHDTVQPYLGTFPPPWLVLYIY